MSNASSPRRGGTKRDSWRTFHRRLFLVRRLVRGPADAPTLMADTRAFFNQAGDAEDIYPPDARTALRHDLAALREEFGCTIDRVGGCFYLSDYGRLALLDLPDDDLEALAFLLSWFDDSSLPYATSVAALLDRIVALLPPERRQVVDRDDGMVRLELPRPSRSLEPETLARVRRALGRQQISFAYRSTFASDDRVVIHRVAPYKIIFRDGHNYLDAYCIDCGDASIAPHYQLYRMERIVADSIQILPNVLPPLTPPRPRYRLHYTLSAAVARQRDIALWFQPSDVHFLPDGSAEIHAECNNLWQARQILLRYREHCVVHEPPELVAMIRESIRGMAEAYNT
ncbi:helix-turn-helix transcriptional regulator [Candidatus Viridilinea mediisalina]|uniref:Uncharacterized protein n=1 Tax=Candidatus Viridilinea mediisalina TaxID=2024553 RepID=A0A2A6RP50_9CHLR|nr:WYL domain-containing protein [Candidatus Viridilinea mediisalina]PDW04671.1 hypothetical protein CJ255_02525 [Candidatus Viridilinea mediisalina]